MAMAHVPAPRVHTCTYKVALPCLPSCTCCGLWPQHHACRRISCGATSQVPHRHHIIGKQVAADPIKRGRRVLVRARRSQQRGGRRVHRRRTRSQIGAHFCPSNVEVHSL
jgi:hypothetical protein